ncbi:sensor histidine kinase [Thermodesulfobacterium hydrogeniphilum]|uniref:sensor histidine kinase n=1 Tax=Thermodesulfobacterium hydrogeniphilum TaxID=161156 RepID=UPI00068D2D8C|nr:ATP-binding protein [Thermodesulfobacterium hydrogeniphilum]
MDLNKFYKITDPDLIDLLIKKYETIYNILDNVREAILLINRNYEIFFLNKQFKKFFGLKGENFENKKLQDFIYHEKLFSIIEEALKKSQEIRDEIEIKEPEKRILSVTAKPFFIQISNEKFELGILLSLFNITKLKRLEQIKTDFVAAVSHEIKTPITAIKGFAETLLEGALDDKENAKKFLEIIKKHSERLNSLVEDLLILSAIELGELQINKTEVNLFEVVDTVITTLENKAKKKNLYLKKEIYSKKIPIIKADRDKLIQILINLVDNSIKFTEKGGITIKYTSSPSIITVEDTGIGIPKEHIPRLGERFYRVDKARSRELGGTGLGLAIVKHFVKAHGWNMIIESEVGKGTKVKLILD